MAETIWVCQACGKTAADKYAFPDVSCFLHAVECDADTLVYDVASHRVVAAEAADAPH